MQKTICQSISKSDIILYFSVRNFIFGSLPIFWQNREWLSTKKSGSGSGVRIGSGFCSLQSVWAFNLKNQSRFSLRSRKSDSRSGSGAVSGVTFRKSGVGLKIWKVNPDFSLPIPKIRDREPFREPFREWLSESGVRIGSEKFWASELL